MWRELPVTFVIIEVTSTALTLTLMKMSQRSRSRENDQRSYLEACSDNPMDMALHNARFSPKLRAKSNFPTALSEPKCSRRGRWIFREPARNAIHRGGEFPFAQARLRYLRLPSRRHRVAIDRPGLSDGVPGNPFDPSNRGNADALNSERHDRIERSSPMLETVVGRAFRRGTSFRTRRSDIDGVSLTSFFRTVADDVAPRVGVSPNWATLPLDHVAPRL